LIPYQLVFVAIKLLKFGLTTKSKDAIKTVIAGTTVFATFPDIRKISMETPLHAKKDYSLNVILLAKYLVYNKKVESPVLGLSP